MKYYLVGIKGTGMSALASMLYDLNFLVLGSDNNNYYYTEEKLKKKKIKYYNFGEFTLTNDYIYIISSAYDYSNDEVKKIIDNNYQYYYYHDFIGKVLKNKIISVSGTHGKTTTSTFIAQFLNYNLSYIIGDGSGGGCKMSDLLLVEACEYKNHFLSYHPEVLLITNIELDHPDYFKDITEVINSFQLLVNQSKKVIINGDDKNCMKLTGQSIIKVGQDKTNDVIFKIEEQKRNGYIVNIRYNNQHYIVEVPFLGIHMVYDYVLAYVLALTFDVELNTKNIKTPSRRFEEYLYGKTVLIDDYAHHPTEIKALCESVRLKYPHYLVNVIFQPHTYSRTIALGNEFVEALKMFDCVYIEKVFTSQREKVNETLQKNVDNIFCEFLKFKSCVLKDISKDKDEVWVFLGAGEINKYINLFKNF